MRQTTREIGAFGEQRAMLFLERRGYHIKESNWRFKRYEIDIIACFEDMLVFVEVKTRGYNDVTKPEAAVTMSQWGNIARAAGVYMARVDYDWEVRFDIVAITNHQNGTFAIEHFKDIYFPGRY
ncbi:MAG: endonuclease [Bacteroidetes bacterium]|nr:MAG: endonuclease [Bacteroidota bacterium]